MDQTELNASIVREALDPASPGVIYLAQPLADPAQAFLGCKAAGPSFVWADYLRPLAAWEDISFVIGAAFGIYNYECVDGLYDWMTDTDFVPPGGCILYFDKLHTLAADRPHAYSIAVQVLADTAEYWQEYGYHFRSLVCLGHDELRPAPPLARLRRALRRRFGCLAQVRYM